MEYRTDYISRKGIGFGGSRAGLIEISRGKRNGKCISASAMEKYADILAGINVETTDGKGV